MSSSRVTSALSRVHGSFETLMHTLELESLAEFREMWEWRRLGKNGKDEPLTAEQELRAVGRRSTVGGRRSAVGGRRSAVGRRSIVGGRRSAVGRRSVQRSVGGRRSHGRRWIVQSI